MRPTLRLSAIRAGLLPLIFILNGCVSLETNPNATIVHEVRVPLAELRALLVAQLPMGMAWTSNNGRELISKYFLPGPANTFVTGDESSQRYNAKITLLGDRRPYDIEVLVMVERRVLRDGVIRYAKVGHDERLTKRLVDAIRRELAKRRDDHNVIDDFRVY